MTDSRSFARAYPRSPATLVLGLARAVATIIAVCGVLAGIGAAVMVIVFQVSATSPAPQVAIPARYSPAPPKIDVAAVTEAMTPPSDIHFVPAFQALTDDIANDRVIGHFAATAPAGIAPFPSGFRVVGGTGAVFVSITQNGVEATGPLVAKIASDLKKVPRPAALDFTLAVLASNRFGAESHETISVRLPYASASPTAEASSQPAAENKEAGAPQKATKLTPLQAAARAFALAVDPKQTVRFFQAYQSAINLPSRCNAEDNDDFVSGFANAVAQEKAKLDATNGSAFLDGVCHSWRAALNKQRSMLAASNVARQEAFGRQRMLDIKTEASHAVAKAKRDFTLSALGVILGGFLVIALVLAFLTLERHTMALQALVRTLVDRGVDTSRADAVPEGRQPL